MPPLSVKLFGGVSFLVATISFIAGQLFLELSFHVKHKLLIEKKTNQLTNQSPNQQQQWQSTPHEHI